MIKIGGLEKSTLIDYPGHVACTVFLIGCNFCCPFCYSSELVLPEKIKLQPKVSEKDFFSFLKKRQGLIDGVVVCGGEPTLQKDLPAFIKKIKNLGYLVKLDTNGSNPEMLEKLIKRNLLNYIAMDVKAPVEKQKYEKATGVKVNLEKIRKSIELIKNSEVDYEFRTTAVPGIHTKEDIIKIAEDIGLAKKYCLQNFRPEKTINPRLEEIRPYSKEFLAEVKKEVSRFFEICQIRD
ncbi:MAG: anaerobic ribonucleoside-triphosphate reductase activating protein [bacterium]|nr:anaerobic ribonucleoside-triphosphate reductase activating protein [bacterium]